MLEVRLSGGLALRAGGAELAPPASRRGRGVLAYLALHPGPHTRAQLAARFWPNVLDESARTSLRAALSELRRALGPAAGHLVATRETVALDVRPPASSPAAPRTRWTRSCAPACCARRRARSTSSSPMRSCARPSSTSSTSCGARGCTAARRKR